MGREDVEDEELEAKGQSQGRRGEASTAAEQEHGRSDRAGSCGGSQCGAEDV